MVEKKHASVGIYGVDGSASDRCPVSKCPVTDKKTYGWIDLWEKNCNPIGERSCCAAGCQNGAVYGGHVWLVGEDGVVDKRYCYIAPVCPTHNNKQCDWPGFMTKPGTWLMRILPHTCYKG